MDESSFARIEGALLGSSTNYAFLGASVNEWIWETKAGQLS